MVGIERCGGSLILYQNDAMSVLQRRAKAARNSWKSMLHNPKSSCQILSAVFLPRQSSSLHSSISSGSFLCPLGMPLPCVKCQGTGKLLSCPSLGLLFSGEGIPWSFTVSSGDVWSHFTSRSLPLEDVYLLMCKVWWVGLDQGLGLAGLTIAK